MVVVRIKVQFQATSCLARATRDKIYVQACSIGATQTNSLNLSHLLANN